MSEEETEKRNKHIDELRGNADTFGEEQADGELLTVTFKPGKVGFSIRSALQKPDWFGHGRVTGVFPGGQAEALGIKIGDIFKFIDGEKYSLALFDTKIAGTKNYKVSMSPVVEDEGCKEECDEEEEEGPRKAAPTEKESTAVSQLRARVYASRPKRGWLFRNVQYQLHTQPLWLVISLLSLLLPVFKSLHSQLFPPGSEEALVANTT